MRSIGRSLSWTWMFSLGGCSLSNMFADYTAALVLDDQNWLAYFHRWQAHEKLYSRAAADVDRAAGSAINPDKFKDSYSPHGGAI